MAAGPAQGYDFSDLAFITTSEGVVAIDAGTTPGRVKAALGDLDPPADGAVSHLILTHAHWDHIGGASALRGPGTRVIAQAGFPAGLARQQAERPLSRSSRQGDAVVRRGTGDETGQESRSAGHRAATSVTDMDITLHGGMHWITVSPADQPGTSMSGLSVRF